MDVVIVRDRIDQRISVADRFQWGPVPAVPYYLTLAARAAILTTHERYGIGWPASQLFFTGAQRCLWIGRQSAVNELGLAAARRWLNPHDPLHALTDHYRRTVRRLETLRRTVLQARLTAWSDRRLHQTYRRLAAGLDEFWTSAIFPELMGYGISAHLERELSGNQSTEGVHELVRRLASARTPTFFQREEVALLTLLGTVPVRRNVSEPFQPWLTRRAPQVAEALNQHARQYAWLLNNYASGAPLTPVYFFDRVERFLAAGKSITDQLAGIRRSLRTANQRRQRSIESIPSGELQTLAARLSECISWHDHRKAEQLKLQTVQHQLLEELSRRRGIPLNDLLRYTGDEILALVDSDQRVSATELTARRTFAALFVEPTSFQFTTSPVARRLYNTYQSFDKPRRLAELRGTVASTGAEPVVRGTVRILAHPADGDRLAAGDILVAAMTSPDYIDAIRRSAGIITDVGGLTSHAAVVSRELGKPCIVGTKIATKVFKDGDLVEVDATNGVVQRISV